MTEILLILTVMMALVIEISMACYFTANIKSISKKSGTCCNRIPDKRKI
jgi:collagenase-like PrtC family protease